MIMNIMTFGFRFSNISKQRVLVRQTLFFRPCVTEGPTSQKELKRTWSSLQSKLNVELNTYNQHYDCVRTWRKKCPFNQYYQLPPTFQETYKQSVRRCTSDVNDAKQRAWMVRTTNIQQHVKSAEGKKKTVEFRVAYIDTAGDFNEEDRCKMPTVLGIHGAPGSHKDIVPLLKTLAERGARVLVVNFPGYDITVGLADEDEVLFTHSTEEKADYLLAFLEKLGVNRLDMGVGHSAGTFPLVYLASLSPVLKSLAFVSPPAGHTPAKTMRPYWLVKRLPKILEQPILGSVLRSILGKMGGFLGLGTVNAKHVIAATHTAARVGFDTLPMRATEIRKKNLPLLLVMSHDDRLVELYKANEWAEQLGPSRRHFTVYDKKGNLQNQGEVSEDAYRMGIFFQKGGHFPQRRELLLPVIIEHIENLFEHVIQESH